MIDGVTSITDALGGSSTTVSATSSKIKLRLGKLTGITDASLGGSLNGYGLYADNAYLKGKIIANSGGTISNWIIGPDELYSNNIHLHTDGTNGYLSVGTSTYNTNGIWIGIDTNPKLSIKNGNQYILFDGTNISIQTPNFTASGGNVYLTGTITASAGAIANWSIGTDKLYSGNVTLSSQNNNQYLGIGSNAYGNNGIYIGFSNSLNRLSLVNNLNKFLWDGTQLGISSSNFTLSQGKITATAGTIANWGIDTNKLTSSATSASIELRTSPSSAWNIVGTNGYVFGNT
jgi:phage baseplate assembly protein gpV